MIDITVADSPRTISSVDTPGFALGVTLQGRYAYVADGRHGLQVIDIGNPTEPRQAGSISLPGEAKAVAVVGNYAYVAADDGDNGHGGLRIVDISNPAKPVLVSTLDTGDAQAVAVVENYAYVVGYSLRVVDVIEPAQPRQLGIVEMSAAFDDVTIVDGYAFMSSNRYCDITVFCPRIVRAADISNPEMPELSSNISLGSNTTDSNAGRGLRVLRDLVFVATDTGLQVLSISSQGLLKVNAELKTVGPLTSVMVLGQFAYVGASNRQLLAIDVTDPTMPILSSALTLSQQCESCISSAGNVVGEEGRLYVSMGEDGLRIIDAQRPHQLAEIGWLELPMNVNALAVIDHRVLAVGNRLHNTGLYVIDVSNPSEPQELAFIILPETDIADLAVAGQYAYVVIGACNESGCHGTLHVFDMSDPTAPNLVSSVAVPGYSSITATEEFVYAARQACFYGDCSAEIGVIDLGNPNRPLRIASQTLTTAGRDLAVMENNVFVLGEEGMQIIDVSSPVEPRVIGTKQTVAASQMAISSGHVYIADLRAGLLILDVGQVSKPK